jgi:hypothetical protein
MLQFRHHWTRTCARSQQRLFGEPVKIITVHLSKMSTSVQYHSRLFSHFPSKTPVWSYVDCSAPISWPIILNNFSLILAKPKHNLLPIYYTCKKVTLLRIYISGLERLHTRAARIIYRLNWDLPSQEVIHKTGWKTLSSTYRQRVLSTVHKCCYGEAPDQLCQNIITKKDNNLRGSEKLVIPRPETNFLHKSVTFRGAVLWNKLPANLKSEERHNNLKCWYSNKISPEAMDFSSYTNNNDLITIFIFKLF